MPRRDFLKAAPIGAYAIAQMAHGAATRVPTPANRIALEPFDYRGVRLRESRWQQQYQSAYRMHFENDKLPFVLW